jgi:hypothetical protein
MSETVKLQPYSAEVAEIAARGAELQSQAEAFVIACDEDDLAAKTMLAEVRSMLKEADAKRKQVKEPYLRAGKEIDAAFRTAAAPWQAAESALVGKTGAWHKAKVEAEQAALRERERIERERLERSAEQGVTPQPELPPLPSAVASTTSTAAGAVTMVAVRGFQIVDPEQIPREFLTIDRVKIGDVYRKGGDVPGCREDISYVPRTRRPS